ncbi:hypothetical protein M514_04363 [Trichuris suis]|uniref:Uncharacterized protein n=1 Tax=Trichuris suis TaxID=68888 RepID=A0A085MBR7_9BILA|nr:hypothetical protein M513_04363 [Trichuris suis]KFD64409.1 hypothetical protein M514_04363 [Trichuris suis]
MEDTQEVIESRDCVFKENSLRGKAPDRSSPVVDDVHPRVVFPEEEPNADSYQRVCLPDGPTIKDDVQPCVEPYHVEEQTTREPNQEVTRENPLKCPVGVERVRSHPMSLRDQKRAPSSSEEVTPVDAPFCSPCAAEEDGTVPYHDAVSGPEAAKWLEAMEEEMENLREHRV